MQYRTVTAALLVGIILAACGTEEPAVDTAVQPASPIDSSAAAIPEYPIEDFMNSTAYSGASFSPDGSNILVSHNRTGIFNVYSIASDGSGEQQLTDSDTDAMLAVSYFPDDERFLYTADQGGNELNHLYLRELYGSEVDLNPGENLKAAFAGYMVVAAMAFEPEVFEVGVDIFGVLRMRDMGLGIGRIRLKSIGRFGSFWIGICS